MEEFNDMFTEQDNDKIVVDLVNSSNGISEQFDLYPENTLGEVVETARKRLGLGDSKQINIEYNGKTTADMTKTIDALGVVSGSKILIHPNACVA